MQNAILGLKYGEEIPVLQLSMSECQDLSLELREEEVEEEEEEEEDDDEDEEEELEGECISASQIIVHGTIVEKSESNHPDSHGPSLPALSQYSFHSAIPLHPFPLLRKTAENFHFREISAMGSCVSTKRCFSRFTRRRRVRKEAFVEAGQPVEECVEGRDIREDTESECSQSLREFLSLERMCEEYEKMEEEKRRNRIEQKKLEIRGDILQGSQLSTIEEEDEEEADEEEEEEEEGEDNRVRELGEEFERPDNFPPEGKDATSVGDDRIKGEKLMSFEEFCGETFTVSPRFVEDIMEETRISQRMLEIAHEEFGRSLRLYPRYNEVIAKLAEESKENEVHDAEVDTLSMQEFLRLERLCAAE
ncbi:hypothetical protein ACTXT7_011750 [Hymenolepis weldensis]